MKKRLKSYLSLLEELDYDNMTESEKGDLKTEMLNQIGFFQHERLIHLIVTVTIALLAILALYGSLTWMEVTMFIATGLLFILLIVYIIHYYYMENGVQKLYGYYDKTTE